MTTSSSDKALEILLVEDNPADARLAQETIAKSQHRTNITLAEDGEQALTILRKEGDHANALRPDLILLDLKLPGKDGQEVLAEMYEDADLKPIPVMILTGTEAERAILATFNVPPSRFVRKPITVDRFDMAINQLKAFSREPLNMGASRSSSTSEPAKEKSGKRWWWPFG